MEGTSDRIEEVLFGADASSEAQIAYAELVTECARHNGLDGYTEDAFNDGSITVRIDPAPGLSGRERAAELGTGYVSNQIVREEGIPDELLRESPDELSDVEFSILNSGPIQIPGATEQFSGGCRPWADNEIRSSSEQVALEQTRVAYGEWMEEHFTSSLAHRDLESLHARCMADEGYPEVDSIDALNEVVFEADRQRVEGLITPEEAVAIDRRVGLAYFDCSAALDADFEALADEAALAFLEQNDLGDLLD